MDLFHTISNGKPHTFSSILKTPLPLNQENKSTNNWIINEINDELAAKMISFHTIFHSKPHACSSILKTPTARRRRRFRKKTGGVNACDFITKSFKKSILILLSKATPFEVPGWEFTGLQNPRKITPLRK